MLFLPAIVLLFATCTTRPPGKVQAFYKDVEITKASWTNNILTFTAPLATAEGKLLVEIQVLEYTRPTYGNFAASRLKTILINGKAPGCTNTGIEKYSKASLKETADGQVMVSFDTHVKCVAGIYHISGRGLLPMPQRQLTETH